ncbi:unnamed protein product [Bemisia tabaci]|uniref:Uncharacterized protein n=1 Tax=Bemisia tabaci TaxID=7038 RepID=A0A9P0A8D9_BEMTA|nr:unnamed protein product [Bemisia tabaci]
MTVDSEVKTSRCIRRILNHEVIQCKMLFYRSLMFALFMAISVYQGSAQYAKACWTDSDCVVSWYHSPAPQRCINNRCESVNIFDGCDDFERKTGIKAQRV